MSSVSLTTESPIALRKMMNVNVVCQTVQKQFNPWDQSAKFVAV